MVVISIDQFRADYVSRFSDYYLPARSGNTVGGFKYLTASGAVYTDAHYTHLPTETGPGHATILTGSVPSLNGIAGNDWFDRASGKTVYCADDPKAKTVGGQSKPMSPRNLQVTTVGDELKMATNGKAKVVGISFKDRAAIFLAGHAADAVVWFEPDSGNWVSSDFYGTALPKWVSEQNARKIPEAGLGKTWTPMLPDSAYALTRIPPFEKASPKEPIFSHSLGGDNPKSKFRNWTTSPEGQAYVLDTATLAVTAEDLGKDDVPDLLAINLATNDYVGHAYGPNSPEVMDISVATDRLLSKFFNDLDKRVPGGLKNVSIVVTADHGVLPIVEEMASVYRIPSGRLARAVVTQPVQVALEKQFGPGEWIRYFDEPNMYLNRELADKLNVDFRSVCEVAARAAANVEGIFTAVPGHFVLEGRVPATAWGERLTNGYNPRLSGDVMVLQSPGVYFGSGTGTGHGSPWAYDTHVPIILQGFGINQGMFGRRVAVVDIAPTLSKLLGIEQPSGSIGRVLTEALK